jgi:transcriptional regulator with XRE-family HTH domain
VFEIGSSLREARIRQDLTFEEMEARTKVRAKYLRHLEEERFDQLPGHAYTKGFLQVYADELGLDGRLYLEEYNSRYVAGEEGAGAPRVPHVPSGRQRRRHDRRESGTVGIALAAILLVTALVIAAWRFGGHDDPQVDGVNAPTPRSTAASKPRSTQQQVILTVRALRGPSFMEVRAGSATGKPLYTGTLEKGQFQRFTKKALYLSLERPRNVVVKVDGRRYVLRPGEGLTVSGATAVSG